LVREYKAPIHTLERLATYFRYLNDLISIGVETISSADMEAATGVHAAQFRKDLSYFGEFGRPGIGYNVADLHVRIARILKVDSIQPVILVGAGNLGSALSGYSGLRKNNFNIAAIFDNSPHKIGYKLWDIEIRNIEQLQEVNNELKAKIAILTVPAVAAQGVVDKLVSGGIKVILNFAPTSIRVPDDVLVRNVCFIQELTVLSYHLSSETSNDEIVPLTDDSGPNWDDLNYDLSL
jgi:redox-sensing transcriptional repressor